MIPAALARRHLAFGLWHGGLAASAAFRVTFESRSHPAPGSRFGTERVSGKLAIHEAARPLLLLGGMAVLIVAAPIVGLPLLVFYRLYDAVLWGLLLVFLLIGMGLLAALMARFRRWALPFLIVTPKGFSCPGLATPIVPWTDVDHAAVTGIAGSVTTSFTIAAGAKLPVSDGSRGNVRVWRRSRQVIIGGPAPTGPSLAEYGACIANAIDAAKERQP